MTWMEMFLAGAILILSWAIGLVMVQFPGGVYARILRKVAKIGLNLAKKSKWLYLTWTSQPLWNQITYYEGLELMSKDPVGTIEKYTSWAILLYRLFGLVWLGSTAVATYLILQIIIGGK